MDDNSICITSVSERENREAMCNSSVASLGDYNTIDKMSTDLSRELKINDGNQTNPINHAQSIPVEGYYIEEEEEDEDYFSEESFLAQMGYSEPNRDYEEEEDENLWEAQIGYLNNDRPNHEPITTPLADLNLISAFKGSREKEGRRPAKEHRVSWAPDVCDPPCSSREHLTLNKNERRKSEQKAKGATERNKEKAAKSKDKKQANNRSKKSGSDHGES